MPIYEYQCADCGEVFEVWQKVSDPPPAQHQCGSSQVRRVLSNTSFRLKGSGWYMTDYPRSGGGEDKPAGPGTTSGDEANQSPQSKDATAAKETAASPSEKSSQDKSPSTPSTSPTGSSSGGGATTSSPSGSSSRSG